VASVLSALSVGSVLSALSSRSVLAWRSAGTRAVEFPGSAVPPLEAFPAAGA
jgi:hypothetical protein